MTRERPGRYLFAVTRGLTPADLSGVAGFDGAPLRDRRARGLQAVVCDGRPRRVRRGGAARATSRTWPGWRGSPATHHDVVYAVAATGTVAPMRLVTIYRDDDSRAATRLESRTRPPAALDRVEGRASGASRSTPPRQRASPGAASSAAPAAGRVRRTCNASATQADRRRAAGASAHAGRRRDPRRRWPRVGRRPPAAPQDPRLTGRPEPMTLNGAYLVACRRGRRRFARWRDESAEPTRRAPSRSRVRGRRTPSRRWMQP